MNEDKKICYPYAYGRLDGGLSTITARLASTLYLDEDLKLDPRIEKVLNDIVKDLRDRAVEESYKHF